MIIYRFNYSGNLEFTMKRIFSVVDRYKSEHFCLQFPTLDVVHLIMFDVPSEIGVNDEFRC